MGTVPGNSKVVQFSSVTQSCPTLYDPVDYTLPGFSVHHQLLELAQTHVHQVSDAIQPSHPLSSPSSPALNLSQLFSACSCSDAKLCPTLCDPMDYSKPGLPVYRQLTELAQTHVHQVSDAIQPSHPLSSPSPPAFNLSQHQGLFQ